MSSPRWVRAAVTSVAGLALITAGAPVAVAGEPVTGARAVTQTTAERCAQERQQVKAAKARLARAKQATVDRAEKVARAKKRLQKEKRQRARWCSAAKSEAAADAKADATKKAWQAFRNSPAVNQLPTQVRQPMITTIGKVVAAIDRLRSDSIPGADMDELARITTLLTALDPSTTLKDSVTDFVLKVQSSGDPDAMTALINSLVAGLPNGAGFPGSGDMAKLEAAMKAVVAALQAFKPEGGAAEMATLVAKITQAAAQIQQSAGLLDGLFAAVREANGGQAPTDDTFTALFGGLLTGGGLPFPLPTDLEQLADLDVLLGSVGDLLGPEVPLPGIEEVLPGVIETVVDGGVDLGTIVEVVDPGGVIGEVVEDIIGGIIPWPFP